MRKMLIPMVLTVMTLAIVGEALVIRKLYVFAEKLNVWNDHIDAKTECSIALAADTRYQIVRDRGEELHKANVWYVYANDIPACAKFYGEYECWMLDINSDASLDKCGTSFGYTKEEVEQMKKTRQLIERKD